MMTVKSATRYTANLYLSVLKAYGSSLVRRVLMTYRPKGNSDQKGRR